MVGAGQFHFSTRLLYFGKRQNGLVFSIMSRCGLRECFLAFGAETIYNTHEIRKNIRVRACVCVRVYNETTRTKNEQERERCKLCWKFASGP